MNRCAIYLAKKQKIVYILSLTRHSKSLRNAIKGANDTWWRHKVTRVHKNANINY